MADEQRPPPKAPRLNLSNQTLQGAGAIASLIAAIAATVVIPASCDDPQPAPARPAVSTASTPAGALAVNNGDCNIVVQGQAAGVQANCAPAARNIATGNYGSPRWLFEGTPEQLYGWSVPKHTWVKDYDPFA